MRRRNLGFALLWGACFIGLAAAALLAGQQAPVPAGQIGSQLPVFSVKDLRGRAVSSADFRGKVLLVDFWATWCEPCKKEMPAYQKLAEKYGPKGLAVIGFKMNDMPDTENPNRFARRMGVRYPLAETTEELVRQFGGIEGLPTTLLYDRQGKLVKKVIGFEYAEVFEAAAKALL